MRNIENLIEMRENAPEYAKKFSSFALFDLMRLQEEFQYDFCYGLNGLRYRCVEIFVSNNLLQELKENLPFECKESRIYTGSNRRVLSANLAVNKYRWRMNRAQSKKFFSIFSKINPRLDRAWIHFANNIPSSNELTKSEVHKVYYGKNKDEEYRKVVWKYIGNPAENLYNTKRISVIFSGNQEKHGLNLIFIENARPETQTSILKLQYYYDTFDDSESTQNPSNLEKGEKKKKRKFEEEIANTTAEEWKEIFKNVERENVSQSTYIY